MRRRLSPSLVVSMLALFVALGGSAIAIDKAAPVTRCGNGSLKAYASLNLDQFAGAFPTAFASNADLFQRRWSCAGRGAEVRLAGDGAYEVRFPGIQATAATVTINSTAHPGFATYAIVNGVFRIYTRNADGTPLGIGFTIAAF
jgi:hypothetical protein